MSGSPPGSEPAAAPAPAAVASPCVRLCAIDPQTGLCRGCRRTLDEIARWGAMTEAERAAVIAALPHRAASGV